MVELATSRRAPVLRAARLLGLNRDRADRAVDAVRLWVDRQAADYQPQPWFGRHAAERSEGAHTRWAAIQTLISESPPRNAVDVGCNAGFFAIHLAQAGIPTLGIESDPRYFRLYTDAITRLGLRRAGSAFFEVNLDTISLVPQADLVVFLSVWHHIVRWEGLEYAVTVLEALWELTGRTLIFDTGESEMGPEFRLPTMNPTPERYLDDLLKRCCPGGVVRHLGVHQAFDPVGNRCERNLFGVVREP